MPVLTMGLSGFVGLLTDGKITEPDGFLLHLLSIDFAKNIFIERQPTLVLYVHGDPVSQQQQAYAHMIMLAAIMAVQFINPNESPTTSWVCLRPSSCTLV